MKIVVLGAAGFIGQHLIKSILVRDPGANIVAVTRQSDRLAFGSSVQIVQSVLGADPALIAACRDASVIVHLAWSTTPSSSNIDPLGDVKDNLLGSVNFLEAISRDFRNRLIFISSGGTVYGQPISVPIQETHPIRPITSYGITKFGVEEYVELYSSQWNFDCTILRPANLYGPGQILRKGQGLIPAILGSLRNNEPFVMWGDGSAVRDYVFVSDVVEAILTAIESSHAVRKRLNIGSGTGNSVIEVIETIERITNRKVVIDHRPARLSDVPVNVLDITNAKRFLGWQPQVTLEEGLRRTIAGEFILP
jgi:UDP-glucose 4-epimerase